MNNCCFVGRLTRDPEVRYGQNNTCIARFSIAVDRRFKRDGQPDADFFNCTAFGKTAEVIEKYCKKGTKLALQGEMQNDNYKNKEGQMIYGFQFIVNSLEFCESKGATSAAPAPKEEKKDEGWMDIPDNIGEDLPFV